MCGNPLGLWVEFPSLVGGELQSLPLEGEVRWG
jgi:hypothetical protein